MKRFSRGGGGHTGYEGAWRHCKTNSALLAIYISTWNTKKRILLCKCFQESKLLQEYREKGLNENHNENVHFFQNFPEYDLASALGSNDVGHPFERPHQVPGDSNCLCKLYYACNICLAENYPHCFSYPII